MQNIIDEIRRYNKLKMITDDEIIPYIEMADFEIGKYNVKSSETSSATPDASLVRDPADGAGRKDELGSSAKLKARAFYTLALLGQKLWLKIQQRANEYDESLDTFKDVKQWEEYWMDKFYKLTTKKNTSGYFYAAV